MSQAVSELTSDERPVVLLTLREAVAIRDALQRTQPNFVNEDLERARHVLEHQLAWLKTKGY